MPDEQIQPSLADDIQESKIRELLRTRVQNILSKNMVEEHSKLEGTDPSKTYEWINIDPRRVATYEAREYQVCNKINSPNLKGRWRRNDGQHIWGDSILMMVDADLKKALDAAAAFRALERDRRAPGGYDKEFAEWARQNRVASAPLGLE